MNFVYGVGKKVGLSFTEYKYDQNKPQKCWRCSHQVCGKNFTTKKLECNRVCGNPGEFMIQMCCRCDG